MLLGFMSKFAPSMNPRKHPTVKWRVFWSESENGKFVRKEKNFAKKSDAKTWFTAKRKIFQDYGRGVKTVPHEVKAAVGQWLKFEESHKEFDLPSLGEVIAAAISRFKDDVTSVTLEDLTTQTMAFKKKNGISGGYISDLKTCGKKLTAYFGANKLVSQISKKNINDYLYDLLDDKELEPQTVKNSRASASNLFAYAFQNEWVRENVVEKSFTPRIIGKDIEFYTAAHMELMLKTANPTMTNYIILQSYCGVRVSELKRLDWSAICMQNGVIRISEAIGKTGKRIIHVEEGVMKRITVGVGRVFTHRQSEYKEDYDKALKSAKCDRVHNGFRHSFATHHFAKFQDWMRTTNAMGNSRGVFQKHYDGIVAKKQGDAYFDALTKSK